MALIKNMDDKKIMELRLKAEDYKEKNRGAGGVDLFTLGFASESTYDPPSNPEEKAVYDHYFNKD